MTGAWGQKEKNLHVEPAMARALNRGFVTKRPWGRFTTYIVNGNGVTVKTIVIDPGQRLSLQYHSKRSERWVCLVGEAIVEINGRRRILHPHQEVVVPLGAKHRLGAGPLGAKVLEIVQGDFSEDDIVRLEDDYRRV
jgi:mannose-6-phosphate isomerase-like protein (cupin superfamily)